MEKKTKVLTFIGFALRARGVKCGVNAVATIKNGCDLIILCKTASDNTFDDAVKLAKKLSAKLYISKTHLIEEIVNKPNCKLIAITNKELSKAIIDNIDEDFALYSGGYGNEY